MFALYMFGPDAERTLGPRRFTLYYFACVIGAGLAQLWVVYAISRGPYETIGASGGIFGLLLFYGMTFPHRQLLLLFPPVPMPAWLFVTLYGDPGIVARGIRPKRRGWPILPTSEAWPPASRLILYWRSVRRSDR